MAEQFVLPALIKSASTLSSVRKPMPMPFDCGSNQILFVTGTKLPPGMLVLWLRHKAVLVICTPFGL